MTKSMNSGVILAGTPVNLMEFEPAVSLIMNRAMSDERTRLAVVSVNLDHLHHFGVRGRWAGTLHSDPASTLEWLYLLDGSPLVQESRRLTDHEWPRLAGSELAYPILVQAELLGLSVGFLGGSEATQALLRRKLSIERPQLKISGMWSPSRVELNSDDSSQQLAQLIANSGTQILFVGLGKPRQELWIDRYGEHTGASVLLAFGAAVDFMAGRVGRAPVWARDHGLEWCYRLAKEPRRLARRYLIDGPEAYIKLKTKSSTLPAEIQETKHLSTPAPRTPGYFTESNEIVDAVAIVVTYNSANHIGPLLDSLRQETADLTLRVIVADNSSDDETVQRIRTEHPDVCVVNTGGNLGYSAGINVALARAGESDSVIILNPDLTIDRGSLRFLWNRLQRSHAGVVVPKLVNERSETVYSIHREPTLSRAVCDAILGSRIPDRPNWLAETDCNPESYRHAHIVEWATGAAMMIRRSVADQISWDESYFLYSEETDYCRRVRKLGHSIWFEPRAVMTHTGGGSGSSASLNALLSVNRIRYIRKHHSSLYSAAYRFSVVLSEALRFWKTDRRGVLSTVLKEAKWSELPGPSRHDASGFPSGAVIIPAHNEAAVIARALAPLAPLTRSAGIEVIVSCNGCSDDTAQIARTFEGVTVVEIEEASKTAALNVADSIASQWPRLYMDADVEVGSVALRELFLTLSGGEKLAARPVVHYDLHGANPLIRSYYHTRTKLPSVQTSLWAGGVYAISEKGHRRFTSFPDLISDDLFIDRLFAANEKTVLEGEPVVFRPPRTLKDQFSILHRVYRGNSEQNGQGGGHSTARNTLREVLSSVRGPISATNAVIYFAFALIGRRGASRSHNWERDESSRGSDRQRDPRS
ncbi:exopolysaccharide biosynthesis WecB/TagA/CpsF family protein [Arthrobacter pascens]|uniref:WecB/TagA/CpsF family glycosyltransferase n=1 Tax=Arthrobacter pascens TaxID=1677 RepID=UPI0027818E45|nr:WecB/TagA/CpsF family glycosyltransferase [Arthrobacter pascens]MDQ0636121.1 exopolysaccharide biosynthesis WecB/TagA/CpsF family protein [Arthrobacter pascens]